MIGTVLAALSLLLTGILAGEEFIVRWGFQPAMRGLEDRAHILVRMAMVRRLMVVVPVIMALTVLTAVAAVVFASGTGDALVFRWIGLGFLVAFLGLSFGGTVPINIKVNDTWDADSPPSDWRKVVARWEAIDTFRALSALLAFASFLVATVVL